MELAQGVTTRAATCREVSEKPLATGKAFDGPGLSTGYAMRPEAIGQSDKQIPGSCPKICQTSATATVAKQCTSFRAAVEKGASSKNTPKGIGYMLDAAHGCGGQRTHLEKVALMEAPGTDTP